MLSPAGGRTSLRLITLLLDVSTTAPLVVDLNLQLNCLVLGDDSIRMFKVGIAETAGVGDLRELIKQENANTFRDVDANDLDLHQVSLPIDDELDEKLRHLTVNTPLRPMRKLSTCFVQPLEQNIHILVNKRGVCLALLGLLRLIRFPSGFRTTPLQAGEQDDILTALTECECFVVFSCRSAPLINVVQTAFKRTTTITSKSLTPSEAATSKGYLKVQSGDQRIFDCRCAKDNLVNTVAPPIQLFNPAFAFFSSKAFDPNYDVPNDVVRDVWDLMTQFALIHDEDHRRSRLRSSLTKVINYPLASVDNADKTKPDLVAMGRCGNLQTYLVVAEDKNEFGDGGSDPSVQAAFLFQRIFCQEKVMPSPIHFPLFR
jgi:hypothetical protein